MLFVCQWQNLCQNKVKLHLLSVYSPNVKIYRGKELILSVGHIKDKATFIPY